MLNGRRTARLQTRKRYGGRDVHSETTAEEEIRGTGEYGSGTHRANDTVPREMATTTLRWMCVPGAEVRMVKDTYEETQGGVVWGPGISEEFRVDIGLRYGSALSPLLLFAVVEVISRKAGTRDILGKLIYADDLAVLADSEADL